MHKVVLRWISWVFVSFTFPVVVFSQISAPNADYIDSTNYVNNDFGKHPIYVYTPKKGDYEINAEFIAEFVGEDSLNFRWIKYNYLTNIFDDTLKFDEIVTRSIYRSEGEGGYKVHVFNNNVDTIFYAWNYKSSFHISSINIDKYASNCKIMVLETALDIDDRFIYFDLVDATELYLEHFYVKADWVAEPNSIDLSNKNSIDIQFEAPVVYTRFIQTITDNFDIQITDYFDIKEEEEYDDEVYLIATKADLKASRNFIPIGETDSTGQAPLTVQFENLSINGIGFEWTFYNENSWIEHGKDTIMEVSVDELPMDSIRYLLPGYYEDINEKDSGKYNVQLISFGPKYTINNIAKQCVDTAYKENFIVVDSTHIPTFANVFTPNGDTQNDVFYFKDGVEGNKIKPELARSVKSFSIKIYSRWGKRVHSYYGDINDWHGWNGKMHGNAYAQAGVYFYSALIEGWDGKPHNREGFVHLFRDK